MGGAKEKMSPCRCPCPQLPPFPRKKIDGWQSALCLLHMPRYDLLNIFFNTAHISVIFLRFQVCRKQENVRLPLNVQKLPPGQGFCPWIPLYIFWMHTTTELKSTFWTTQKITASGALALAPTLPHPKIQIPSATHGVVWPTWTLQDACHAYAVHYYLYEDWTACTARFLYTSILYAIQSWALCHKKKQTNNPIA